MKSRRPAPAILLSRTVPTPSLTAQVAFLLHWGSAGKLGRGSSPSLWPSCHPCIRRKEGAGAQVASSVDRCREETPAELQAACVSETPAGWAWETAGLNAVGKCLLEGTPASNP